MNASLTDAVTITTTSQYTVIGYTGFSSPRTFVITLAAILSALCLFFSRRKLRGLRLVAVAFCLMAAASVNLGCSGKLPDRNANPTYPGAYTYTVTATDGTLSHIATFSLNVTAK